MEERNDAQPAGGSCCPITAIIGGRRWLIAAVMFLLGAGAMAAVGWAVMPKAMITVKESRLGFDETVAYLEEAVVDAGWTHVGTKDMQKSMVKHGVTFEKRIKVVELCKAEYAKDVLTTDRHVSALMPCRFAVWESDDGTVRVSKMNTGLMGKMFGGKIAEVMGGKVGPEEEAMLAGVVRD